MRTSCCSALLMLVAGLHAWGDEPKLLLWGDTHLHTSYSFDAFLNLNLTADPDVAYRFAEGMPVIHPYTRGWVQLQTPLDFLVVSDHAEFLGGIRDIYYNGIQQPDAGPIDRIVNWYRTRTIRNAINDDTAVQLFVSVLPQSQDPVAAAAGWQAYARNALPGADASKRNAWLETTTANTRTAIVDVTRRREVYAITGPRIRVQCFGGWAFEAVDLEAPDPAGLGYAKGVPMGSDLAPRPEATSRAPSFLILAVKDPLDANLDRVQVVKGWLDSDGTQHERIYDVVWAGDRQPDADGKLPPIGDTVDRKRARYANSIGAAQLETVWTDPGFDPALRAFYYVRVLQIPTPRHSLYDALALSMDAPTEGPSVIQERAFTSPIWYTP